MYARNSFRREHETDKPDAGNDTGRELEVNMKLRHWRVTGTITIKIDSLITDPSQEGQRDSCVAMAIATAMQNGKSGVSDLKVEEWDYERALQHLDQSKSL